MSSVKLGTNRFLDARNKLLELTIPELQKGLSLFEEFIVKRIENESLIDPSSLDRNIISLIKGKPAMRSSSSSSSYA